MSHTCEAKNPQNLDEALENIELERRLADIKYKIVVLSGKGGVGKSTTAANLATSLALAGRHVGLLDIDFHGPSIPKLMGLENIKPEIENDLISPLGFGDNLKVMSLGFLLESEDDAVIWRGPMKMGAIKQMLKDVNWGELDYLIVDSPPGTGDEPLSVVQLIQEPTGAVIVTQPQDISIADVRRSVSFCQKLNLPVLGIIENMSGFVCPHCVETMDIFKSGGGEKLAEKMGVPFLGKIPLDPAIVQASDSGQPFSYYYGETETAKRFEEVVEKLVNTVESDKEKKQEEKPMMPEKIRRYAVPTANGDVCMHFGHCEQFALIDVDVETGRIVNTQMKTPPPHEPGVLPRWLHEQGANIILAGGMGARAQQLFTENSVEVVTGVAAGKPEEIVFAHVKGELVAGENVCDH